MKKFKRTTAVALTLGMLFTSVPYAALAESPAATASTMTQEEAVNVVKKFVSIPEDYKVLNVSFHDAKDGYGPYGRNSAWMITFGKEERYERGNIHAVVDAAKGIVVNLDFFQQDDSTIENSITRDEARTRALEFLKKLAPDKANQVKEAELQEKYYAYGPYGRSAMEMFRFERVVNGIPYPADGITIRVNGKGELRGYNYNWSDNMQFPDLQASVDAAKAREVFKSSLNLQLQYQRIYKPYAWDEIESQLLYGPWDTYGMGSPFPMIDAAKGEAIGMDGKPVPAKPAMEFKPLADKPGAPKAAKELTREEAQAIVDSYNLDLKGYTLETVNFENYKDRNLMWRFHYRMGDPKDYKTMKNITVAIDAKTGELREYYRNEWREGPEEMPKDPKVTREQAKSRAIEFLKSALPTQIDKIALNPAFELSLNSNPKMGLGYPFHSFEFVRLVNGVPDREGGARVVIDPNTGEIREFSAGWGWNDNVKYQPKENVLDLETAKNKYVEKYKLRLQYMAIYDKGQTPYEPGKPSGVALVYAPASFGNMQMLNAVTGEWVTLYGEAPAEPVEINDIQGHWAEKQLRYLADRGVFKVKDGKLEPEGTVTRGDMVKYLLLSMDGPRPFEQKAAASFGDVGKDHPNYNYIEEAAARKWIDKNVKNFRPEDPVTREELSDMVTAVLGYAKLADAKQAFVNHFPDVANDGPYMGDIAIVNALGIMSGWEGKFSPKQSVTKAQAAVVLTKMLDHVKEKNQYPYFMTK
ncbi:YcdB/YcdC domain-containing protein [Effusibacillus lacus]|uniref:SLH domain-containing protein n=1 Tax=Effusibacillus lacus TaxID=1348429 RepID=A0A292YKW1_9BACL|nr:YcdB/YcdC domain-containing protein [Effusibacillus lacus]TCS70497.1 S-layer family protein [Effusibacillus lacus]GAX89549.1 hypothetical protein EFBL_1173 [Effusibacillus lacus]